MISSIRYEYREYEVVSEPIEVKAGETTLYPELHINLAYYVIRNFIVIDDLYDWFGSNGRQEIITDVMEYRVMGAVRTRGYYDPVDTLVTVWHNDSRVVLDAPKNAFQTPITLSDGLNIIRAEVGDVMEWGTGSDSLFMYYTPNQTELYLHLHWKTIDYDSVSCGDLNLSLINLTTQDTCWYHNPNPDWGSKGAAVDNPRLYDAVNQYGNNDAHESIRMTSLTNGDYQIQVHYTQNLDSDTVQVLANMELMLNDEQVDSIWADPPMRLGETWIAGSFSIDNSID